jgi:lipopolysaccharide/colanic/teichoic acid biosynthesis glycosyltransferase
MIVKRCFDLVIASALLLALVPLLLLIALAVAADSGSPVIYRAQRVGRGGKNFTMLKFRTMTVGAAGPAITGRNDPRITRIGAVLRRTKLDELLQLLNVLRGDMSLVGPRPEDARFVAMYTPEQRDVLAIRPGITSPAAVHFRHEERMLTAATPDFEQAYATTLMPAKLALDVNYVRRHNFWWDIAILCQSLAAILHWGSSEPPLIATPDVLQAEKLAVNGERRGRADAGRSHY